jgi:hypothetical protein
VPPASHPRRSSPYLDLAKRLEAYLAVEGVPLEAEGIHGFLATEWDRTIIIDAVGNVRVRSASSISFHLWHWLGFEVLATIPEMPRHTPIPG